MTRRRWWMAAQLALLTVTLVWAGRELARQWQAVASALDAVHIRWGWITVASGIVLGTYAMLIHSWRLLLAGWGGTLEFGDAARIWTIANLGRYLPGKVWSVGALGVMANQAGVSGVAAAGAAVLGTMLNIGAGFGVLALAGAQVLQVFRPWLQQVAVGISVLFVVGTLLLPAVLPPVLHRIARWRGAPPIAHQIPARTLWIAVGINAVSWVCYGMAFAAFVHGLTPQALGSPVLYVVVWTASYLSGYLVLFAPGGIGVREVVMTGGLVALGLAGPGDATLLALTSRVWLTVWEILPGLLALAWASQVRTRHAR